MFFTNVIKRPCNTPHTRSAHARHVACNLPPCKCTLSMRYTTFDAYHLTLAIFQKVNWGQKNLLRAKCTRTYIAHPTRGPKWYRKHFSRWDCIACPFTLGIGPQPKGHLRSKWRRTDTAPSIIWRKHRSRHYQKINLWSGASIRFFTSELEKHRWSSIEYSQKMSEWYVCYSDQHWTQLRYSRNVTLCPRLKEVEWNWPFEVRVELLLGRSCVFKYRHVGPTPATR